MSEEILQEIERLLASSDIGDLSKGLELTKKEISRVGSDEARDLFEVVASLFYFDPIERPDLLPILEEAISLVVGFGKWVIPALVEKLESGDLKAQIAIAGALGRIGADAISPLVREYEGTSDSDRKVFILYALGKIQSPRVVEAAELVLEAAGSQHRELRDTATRALGKLAESIPPSQFPEPLRHAVADQLRRNSSDVNAGIRAKALRSFGKLAANGHLDAAERESLKLICNRVLGNDEHFEWDRAYIVRREAEEALRHI